MILKKLFLVSIFLLIGLPSLCFAQQKEYANSVNAIYGHVFLEGERSDWNLGQIWYARESPGLTSLFRIRYADRFNRSGFLSEIDLYPNLSEKSYAHFKVGAALTRENLFPNFKVSGTIFHNLSKTLVGGLGVDYQSFTVDDILIYNTHLHWYISDYLILAQGLLQVRDKTPLGTAIVTARKYLTNPSYLYIKLAVGQSPQNLRFEQDVLNTFSSYYIAAGSNIELSNRFLLRFAVNYRESFFSSATSRARFGISGGFSYRF